MSDLPSNFSADVVAADLPSNFLRPPPPLRFCNRRAKRAEKNFGVVYVFLLKINVKIGARSAPRKFFEVIPMEIRKLQKSMVQKRRGGGVDLPSNFPAGPEILTYLAISPDQPPPPSGGWPRTFQQPWATARALARAVLARWRRRRSGLRASSSEKDPAQRSCTFACLFSTQNMFSQFDVLVQHPQYVFIIRCACSAPDIRVRHPTHCVLVQHLEGMFSNRPACLVIDVLTQHLAYVSSIVSTYSTTDRRFQ